MNIEQKSREVAAKVLHLGRSCDPELYADEIAEIAAALQSAVADEREECAKECIGYGHICNNKGCHAADATAIRARGQKAEETR